MAISQTNVNTAKGLSSPVLPLLPKFWNFQEFEGFSRIEKAHFEKKKMSGYAVKFQRSLAPLSWFPGSCKPTAHVHQCCRFQSYAKSRRLHAIANEIYKQNLHCVNHIPGIHDNGPPRTTL